MCGAKSSFDFCVIKWGDGGGMLKFYENGHILTSCKLSSVGWEIFL